MCYDLNLALDLFSSEISHLVCNLSSATCFVWTREIVVDVMVTVFTYHPPLAQRQYAGGATV